jgi:hypothetical protein
MEILQFKLVILNAEEITYFLLNAFENEFLSHPDLLGPLSDFFDFDPAMFVPPSPSESLTRSVEPIEF